MMNIDQKISWVFGFIAADGHIRKDRPSVSITIHPQDRDVLEQIKDITRCKSKIFSVKNYSYIRLEIHDPSLCDTLKSIDFRGNPKIPSECIKDFIRGFFDGDGTIYTGNTCHIRFCGKKSLIEYVKNYFHTIGLVNYRYVSDPRPNKNSWDILISGNRARLFCYLLYSDTTNYMRRKHSKYLSLLHGPLGSDTQVNIQLKSEKSNDNSEGKIQDFLESRRDLAFLLRHFGNRTKIVDMGNGIDIRPYGDYDLNNMKFYQSIFSQSLNGVSIPLRGKGKKKKYCLYIPYISNLDTEMSTRWTSHVDEGIVQRLNV